MMYRAVRTFQTRDNSIFQKLDLNQTTVRALFYLSLMEHLEQLRYSGLFKSRVPRYTSYPPANRFIPAEGSLHQSRWLEAVPQNATLSFYVHVPYCKNLCWFCACRTQAADDTKTVDSYVDVLIREIALLNARLPASVKLGRLHLGGGTPTMIRPAQMERLLGAIESALPKADGYDCSIEIDPMHVNAAALENLMNLGMNRARIGVQDFDPVVQRAIGRAQTFEKTFEVVRSLKMLGLQHLDMELLYGLPKQTASSISETIQQVLALEPDRIAVCEYSHVPHLAKRQILIDAGGLPSAENAFLNAQVARHILLTDGFETVGIDHFVKPGDSLIKARDTHRLRRDFEGYSDNASYALIGIGASAISRFPQGYVQNASATSVYNKLVTKGNLAGNRGYGLTHNEQVVAQMIEMLMCRFEIDVDAVHRKFPTSVDFVEKLLAGVGQVYASHVEISPASFVIKEQSRPVARMVCNTLDQLSGNNIPY